MLSTDISDILFGTPSPLSSEVNLGVLKDDQVNIIVHGHEPTLSAMLVEASRDPELIAEAKAAGAEIYAEPETQFYGDRTYRCRDLEGHIWNVAQTVAVVTREEAEAATGLKITGWV